MVSALPLTPPPKAMKRTGLVDGRTPAPFGEAAARSTIFEE
jgi:hypothetical protein